MRKVEKILVPIDFPKSPRERYCPRTTKAVSVSRSRNPKAF